jgi:protein-disulfide isomerase
MTALIELNISAELEHITDVKEISEYGVFGTPAFVINGKVKSVGRVPNREQIKKWITEATQGC